MKTVVTGATGFLGRHLVPLLARRGHEVIAVSRTAGFPDMPGVRSLALDLKSPAAGERLFRGREADALIHLAWQGLPDYSYVACRRNLDMSLHVFEAAAQAGVSRISAAGSCWEYRDPSGAVEEDAPLDSGSPFAGAKNALHAMLGGLAAERSFSFHWLRVFFAYGPGQRESSLLPHVIGSLLRGEEPALRTPEAQMDFIHVSDVARAFAMMVEQNPESGPYNVGSGRLHSVAHVTGLARAALGAGTGDCPRGMFPESAGFRADIDRIRKAVGWEPEIDLQTGVAGCVEQAGNRT